jgi:hypothetical protein
MTAPWDAEAAALETLRIGDAIVICRGDDTTMRAAIAFLAERFQIAFDAGRATARMDRQECATCGGDGNDPGNCDKDCPSCGGSGRATAPPGAEAPMSDAHRTPEECHHARLWFGSGDYYLFCHACNSTWVRSGMPGRPEYGKDASGADIGASPELANRTAIPIDQRVPRVALPASPPPALGDVPAEELEAVRGDIEHRLKFFIIPERRALLRRFLSRIPARDTGKGP